MHKNTLFVAPFDLGRLAMTGAARPVLEEVNSIIGRTPQELRAHLPLSLCALFSIEP
jgi:hypothetical protein